VGCWPCSGLIALQLLLAVTLPLTKLQRIDLLSVLRILYDCQLSYSKQIQTMHPVWDEGAPWRLVHGCPVYSG
jgi:hypothetical protein